MRSIHPLGALALAGLIATGCKSPRPPHEAAQGDVSGEWSAASVATTRPTPAGEIRWRLLLDQGHAGKLEGTGELSGDRGPGSFSVNGIRGARSVNFHLHLQTGGSAKFDGTIMDVRMMVGRLDLDGDTVPVTFTRP
jgi:hypothetical protein